MNLLMNKNIASGLFIVVCVLMIAHFGKWKRV
jgi:hypothetical protein